MSEDKEFHIRRFLITLWLVVNISTACIYLLAYGWEATVQILLPLAFFSSFPTILLVAIDCFHSYIIPPIARAIKRVWTVRLNKHASRHNTNIHPK